MVQRNQEDELWQQQFEVQNHLEFNLHNISYVILVAGSSMCQRNSDIRLAS